MRGDVAQLHHSGTVLKAPDLLLVAQLLPPCFPSSEQMCLLLQILFNINGCCRPGEGAAEILHLEEGCSFCQISMYYRGDFSVCQFEHVLCSDAS